MNTDKMMAEIHYYSQNGSSDFPKVIQMTQTLLENGYRHSEIYFYRGQAHHELNELTVAIPFYKESIKLSDDVIANGYAWTKIQSSHNLANIYFDLDLYNECISTCEFNLNFFTNDSRMLSNQLFYTNALYLTAHCIYLKSLTKTNIDSDSLLGMTKSFSETNFGIDCISTAISFIPNSVDYLFVAGMLYKLNGDLNNARISFTKAANLGDRQSIIQLSKLN